MVDKPKVDKNMADRVGIIIDGCRYEVDAGENLLQACVSLGLDLPYFCWHPALGSVGSCRQCAVIQYQNNEDDRGRLVMACMTPVSEGMRVSLQQEMARQFRKTNIEALMTNHPHDCPVCEEGGNCHLQDMTLMSGHIKRGYPGTKRTHRNQQLGPFLNHEMNRCIACYRCVRFYRDYAGGTDLDVFGSKNHLYFGRAESGVLQSPFAGNLAEICPTGVFTDKPYSRHYVRKWDLQTGAAVCSNCSLGCNINVDERGGLIRRLSNRYHAAINGHFLCDLGRFGYEHVNLSQRLEQPLQRNNAGRTTERLGAAAAKGLLARLVNQNNSHEGGTDRPQAEASCVALGSARSAIENNAALLRLVGKDNFYLGVPDAQAVMLKLLCDAYTQGRVKPSSMKEIEASDAAFIIAEDISHTAPRLALTLRQMSRNAGKAKAQTFGVQIWQDDAVRNLTQTLRSPLHIMASHETELADVAKQNLVLPPEGQLRLLRAVLALLTPTHTPHAGTRADSDPLAGQAGEIVADLLAARRPVLICGTQSNEPELLRLCLEIAQRLQARPQHDQAQAGFYGVTRHANDLFLGLIAQAQSLSPSIQSPQEPLPEPRATTGQGIDSLLSRLEAEPIETLIILETDLYRYCDKDRLDKLLDRVKQLIVIEQQLTATAQMADLLLPASSFAESQGCWLSAEGRLQFSFAAMPAIKDRAQAWQWLSQAREQQAQAQDEPRGRSELIAWLAQALPTLAAINVFATPQQFKTLSPFPIARQPLRASARTALHAAEHVREPQPPADPGSPYVYSMEGVAGFRQAQTRIISVLPAGAWSPKWNSDQAGSIRTALLQSPQDGSLGASGGPPELNAGQAPEEAPGSQAQASDSWRHGICIFRQTEPGSIPVMASSPEPSTAVLSAGVWPLAPDANRYADAELACLGDAIRAAMPEPCVRMHPESADKLDLVQGDNIRLSRYPSPEGGEPAGVCLSCTLDVAVARELLLVPTQVFMRLGHFARVTAAPHGANGGEHD